MAEEEVPEIREPTADEVDDALKEIYGELLDTNSEIIQSSRERASEMMQLRDLFLEQAGRCEEIAALHIRGAQIVGNTVGDILSNEWGVQQEDDEDDDPE